VFVYESAACRNRCSFHALEGLGGTVWLDQVAANALSQLAAAVQQTVVGRRILA
jgi:hypothetical protein